MSVIRKLFGIWIIGKTVSTTTTLFTNLLISMAAIALLAAFAAVFLIIIVCGVLYLSYQELIIYGVTELNAMLILGAVLLLLLLGIYHYIGYHVRQMGKNYSGILHSKTSNAPGVSNIIDSFMDGLLSHSPKRH